MEDSKVCIQSTSDKMDFDSFVNATAVEVKQQLKIVKSSSQKVYDPVRKLFGRIERYDPVEYEVCDVELLGSQFILEDVPLMELFPHHAFRFRAGQRILIDGCVGIIRDIQRKVKIKRGNGSVMKFRIKEESSGTHDCYMSNGKLPTWWDRTSPDKQDMYSTIDDIGYPGSPVLVTPEMKLANESSNFFWAIKNRLKRLKNLILRTNMTRYQVVQDFDIVKKVKNRKIKVALETKVEDGYTGAVNTDPKYFTKAAEVLAPLSQELCEEGSYRMFKLKEGVSVKTKEAWLKEKIMTNGAPRSITEDEVDNLTVDIEWLEQHQYSVEDDLPVKLIVKKRFVEIRWEDGNLEILPVSQVVNMVGIDNSDGSLYEINIETDSVETVPANVSSKLSQNELIHEYNIPWLRNVPRFQKYDFVVDALRKFPSSNTVYGVLKSINPKDFTGVVDWYDVDEGLNTNLLEDQKIVSIFDLEHMDDLHDPLFRIEWREKKGTYGSEIVCSRFGTDELNFLAGYVREINQYGQIVVNADSAVWNLWPCQVKRLDFVTYQVDSGEWIQCHNAMCTDETAMKNSLPDYRWQLIKRTLYPSIDMSPRNRCDLLSEYPRLRKLEEAPSNHWYLGHVPDSVSVSSALDELIDPTIMMALVNQELKKTLIQIEGVDLFFCTYENQPNLASALMVGKSGTIYEDGLFMFDIYFPQEFPNNFPLLHYVCYATNLNPILEDAYACGPLKPQKYLNMTLDEMSDSLKKQNGSNLSLGGSGQSCQYQQDGSAQQGGSLGSAITGDHKRTYNLTDFIWYIQETLFRVSPEDVMGELFTGSLLKDQVSVYHDFLVGKKLEALANMLLCPYEPWREFLQISQECVQRLLESSERILQDRLRVSMKLDGSGDNQASQDCKGSLIFLQRRIEFLKKALEIHAKSTKDHESGHLLGSGDLTDLPIKTVSTSERKRKRSIQTSSISSVDSSNRESSVDGLVLPEIGSFDDDFNPEVDQVGIAGSSLVKSFEDKFADLNLDETIVTECKPGEFDVLETEI